MTKMNLAILYGGKSTEHEVSIRSAESILSVLNKDQYNISLVYLSKKGEWLFSENNNKVLNLEKEKIGEQVSLSNTGYLVGRTVNKSLDIVIPVLHGTMGEDGTVQGLLELAGLPYVGCNVRSSAICMDKDITKKLLKSEGLNVADSVVFKYHEKDVIKFENVAKKLGLPMFIKPVNQGSSVGVSRVTNEDSFYIALKKAFDYDTKVMIESEIIGREIEVSALGNYNPFISLPGEIVSNTEFYSYDSKYKNENGATLVIPANLSNESIEKLQKTALKAFETLDCEGLARIDMFYTEDEDIFINEVNTFPGFTDISMYPKLLEVSGVNYGELIEKLIELALQLHQEKSKLISNIK